MRSSAAAPAADLAARLEDYFDRLWPINRSIAGPGLRASLDILAEVIPTQRHRFPTGTKIFDWEVPREWEVREAYLVDPDGRRRADFAEHNLHLVAHSVPVRRRMSLDQLRPHLHSRPDQPDAIPYVLALYQESWGFCLADRELRELPDGEYEVVIDSELRPGHVEIGEAILPGDSEQEILFSSYLCHPSLANNELSGPLAMAFLYDRLKRRPHRRLTCRFVLGAETIGTLCFLSLRGRHLQEHLTAGYVVTCVGDRGRFTLKTSRRGDSDADRAAAVVLRETGEHAVRPFDPGNGSDERQYCSPGFDLPIASVMRTMYSCYPEYHTSLDDKSFIDFASLAESVDVYERIVDALESNAVWWNTIQSGEPQLGKRGLYPGTNDNAPFELKPTMWMLNLADGRHDLLAIAQRSGQPLSGLIDAATKLSAAGLLERR
jgi:aminopeptidase-like protein